MFNEFVTYLPEDKLKKLYKALLKDLLVNLGAYDNYGRMCAEDNLVAVEKELKIREAN